MVIFIPLNIIAFPANQTAKSHVPRRPPSLLRRCFLERPPPNSGRPFLHSPSCIYSCVRRTEAPSLACAQVVGGAKAVVLSRGDRVRRSVSCAELIRSRGISLQADALLRRWLGRGRRSVLDSHFRAAGSWRRGRRRIRKEKKGPM